MIFIPVSLDIEWQKIIYYKIETESDETKNYSLVFGAGEGELHGYY